MSEKKRPNYTKEFKQDAIKLVIEQRYSCPEVGRQSAEIEVLDYITYYNSMRLHSTLGYQTPLAYEKEHCRMAA